MQYNIPKIPSINKDLIDTLQRDMRMATMILTRIPINLETHHHKGDTYPDISQSYWAFPLVGIALSVLPALIGSVLFSLGIPPLAAATLMILGVILISGALHHDGLADLADSLAGHDPEQRLKIMHDSAIGTYGMLALIVVLILQVSCLAAIGTQNPSMMATSLIAVAAMSRAMMGLQRWQYAPPNPEGLAGMTGAPHQQTMLIGLVLALLAGVIFIGISLAIMAMIVGLATTALLGFFLKSWIGGVNGDGLGATQQISATVMLLIITILL